MADLTQKQCRAILMEALQGVLDTADPPGPFVSVVKFAKQMRANGDVDVDALGNTPCALVAFDRERFGATTLTNQETLLETAAGTGGEATWQVLIAINANASNTEDEMVDLVDDCVHAVTKRLNGYTHPDLLDGAVKVSTSVSLPSSSTVFLHTVSVKLVRGVEGNGDDTADDPDLERVDFDVNHADPQSDETNPVVQGRIDFDTP